RSIDLAGNLYLPPNFDQRRTYAAIVAVHPGGGVKEQVAGLYADLLAKEGFVTLAFDSAYQGASGGTPHFLDMPMTRTDDVFSAVDYMTTLPYVDSERIGVVGVCAGSGYAAKATSLDHRIKALATASAVNTGATARKGWDGKGTVAEVMATLAADGQQRTVRAPRRRDRLCALPAAAQRQERTPRPAGSVRVLPDAAGPAPQFAKQDAVQRLRRHDRFRCLRPGRSSADAAAAGHRRRRGRFA